MGNRPRFFSSIEGGSLQCHLCPHNCLLPPLGSGRCRVRMNQDGKGVLPFYGKISGLAIDPIEKKPLYHFRPGTDILSVGFVGCNLNCPFCQNWHISQRTDVPLKNISPVELASSAAKTAIAYTYSEPLVHIEFLLDCMKEAKNAGVANVLVSNGCIKADAASEVLDLCDAANIDLKCFSEDTYKEVLGGSLNSVTGFISKAVEKGVMLEITTLVVPGINDSIEELDKCRDFIAELHSARNLRVIPWHLSAYHPNWKWNKPRTDPEFLNKAAARAREKLPYVYTGNIPGDNHTPCLNCGKTLINRRGFRADTSGLLLKNEGDKQVYYCSSCGKQAPIR